jgi:hypothetical protein
MWYWPFDKFNIVDNIVGKQAEAEGGTCLPLVEGPSGIQKSAVDPSDKRGRYLWLALMTDGHRSYKRTLAFQIFFLIENGTEQLHTYWRFGIADYRNKKVAYLVTGVYLKVTKYRERYKCELDMADVAGNYQIKAS